ncbi:MAG: hypothetical protein ACRD0K_18875 [Egibacteraceae bacterium]
MTVENRGQQVTITGPPVRALLVTRYTVPLLEAVGVLDRVVAKVGEFPPELYAEPTRAALEDIPTIGGPETSSVGWFLVWVDLAARTVLRPAEPTAP